jgi:hypothetical protein
MWLGAGELAMREIVQPFWRSDEEREEDQEGRLGGKVGGKKAKK